MYTVRGHHNLSLVTSSHEHTGPLVTVLQILSTAFCFSLVSADHLTLVVLQPYFQVGGGGPGV